MNLDEQALQKLAAAFLRTSAMEERERRDEVVAHLPPAIRHGISRRPAAAYDVSAIVRHCWTHSEAAGINQLLDVVRHFENDSIPLQGLEETWLSCQLIDLLVETVPLPDLQAHYQAILDDRAYRFASDEPPADVWQLMDNLWQIPDSAAPMLFGDSLAAAADTAARAEAIDQWVTQAAQQRGISPAELAQRRQDRRQRQAARRARPVHLLVVVRPDDSRPADDAQYYVDFYGWRGPREIDDWRETPPQPRPCPLAAIPALLARVLQQQRDVPALIEFFLPDDLILCPVDQWQVEEGVYLPIRLGTEYPIVVRAHGRLRLLSIFGQHWRQKWALFEQAADTAHVFWIGDEDQYRPQQLLRTLSRGDRACLALSPGWADRLARREFLGAILQAGIPVALWSRHPGAAEAPAAGWRAALEALLAGRDLARLPDWLRDLRQEAEDETHLGAHLALLWDDPGRLPPALPGALLA